MIQKKVALLGAPGVGKTSLVRRFVESLFDEAYLTTIGVKVDKRLVTAGGPGRHVDAVGRRWGRRAIPVPGSYVKGTAGYLLVADGTRPETLTPASRSWSRWRARSARCRYVLVLNKADLADRWCVQDTNLGGATPKQVDVVRTSAKTGEGVEDAFLQLATAILAP